MLFQSEPIASSAVRDLLSSLASTEGISSSQDYLQRSSGSDSSLDSCQFASRLPVDLENFINMEPKQLVMFDKITGLLPAEKIHQELYDTILEMEAWEESNFYISQQFQIFDDPRGFGLFVNRFEKDRKWRLQWRGFNRGAFFQKNSLESRLEMVNSFLRNVTQKLESDALEVHAKNEFLVGPEHQHPRITIRHTDAIFDESIEKTNIECDFSRSELENLLQGISEFFIEFGIEGRIIANHLRCMANIKSG